MKSVTYKRTVNESLIKDERPLDNEFRTRVVLFRSTLGELDGTLRGYKLKNKLERRYRIASVERAVLEGLKFITKVGERTAIKAARGALAKHNRTKTWQSR